MSTRKHLVPALPASRLLTADAFQRLADVDSVKQDVRQALAT